MANTAKPPEMTRRGDVWIEFIKSVRFFLIFIFFKAMSQQTVDFSRFFATRLRVILSGVPPRSHFGYASCFWGIAPKVRQAQDDTFGVRRDAVEIRPSGGSNTTHRVWNLAKNQSYPVTEPFLKMFKKVYYFCKKLYCINEGIVA